MKSSKNNNIFHGTIQITNVGTFVLFLLDFADNMYNDICQYKVKFKKYSLVYVVNYLTENAGLLFSNIWLRSL